MTFIDIPKRLTVIANFISRKCTKLGLPYKPEVAPGVTSGLCGFLGLCRFNVILRLLAVGPTILEILAPNRQIRVATQTGSGP